MGMGQGPTGRAILPRGPGVEPRSGWASEPNSRNELLALKQHAQMLSEELGKIQQRIEQLEKH
jgi:hypothetical protein